ncbi:MAG TPA: TldD/PmbA family protein [Firmicutes bacterium]|nr:TldD/PmbA family protein [Bacillota bacterium]
MERLLNLASKEADAAEVFFIKSAETPVSFEANRLKFIETRMVEGAALRIIRNGRIGFSTSSKLDEPDILVRNAVASSEFGVEAAFEFPATSKAALPTPRVYDAGIADLDPGYMIKLGSEMIARVLDAEPGAKCDVTFTRDVEEISVGHAGGGPPVSYRRTLFEGGMEVTVVSGEDILMVSDYNASSAMNIDFRRLTDGIIQRLIWARRIVPVTTGRYPVIFTSRAMVVLLLALKVALNGKTVLQGASPLAGKLGTRVMDERISLYDDGTVNHAPRSAPFDDEGVPCRRTPLIEGGVVRNFYYDLQTAGRSGKESTGNGWRVSRTGERSFEGQPTTAQTNIVVPPGDMSLERMIESMDEGLIVEQLMGAGQGNILSGAFSMNVHLGYKVEGGRIVGRVKNTMVAGNAFEAFNDVVALGDKAEWVMGPYSVPAFLFRSLSVSTKS